MLEVFIYSIVSVLIVSLVSLLGIFTLFLNASKLQKILLLLVSFSVGALLGDVFIHILPETIDTYGFTPLISIFILSGILFFFILEKFIHWRHCHVYGVCETHDSHRHPHSIAWMNLFGDGMHNFIDGMIIAGSYIVSIPLGVATTIAVVLHEVPQEIGDFGVLLHGGFSRKKALLFNFISALAAIIGALFSFTIGLYFKNYMMFILPFTAGGFIYIAGSDLIPELHKELKARKSLNQLLAILLGIGIMYILLIVG